MTDPNSLDLARFERLLDVHGPDLERWPLPLRQPARRLIETSPVARECWSRARQLSALLDQVPALLPSAELRGRIAALPVRHAQRAGARWWPFENLLGPLLGWGAAVALGFWVGSGGVLGLEPFSDGVGPGADPVTGSEPLGSAAAEGGDVATAEDWSELSELALGTGLAWEEEP